MATGASANWSITQVLSGAFHTSLISDSNNNLHMAMRPEGFNRPYNYAYFDGSSWAKESLGFFGNYAGFAIDSTNGLHAVSDNNYIQYKNSSWVVGGLPNLGGGGYPSIALNSQDRARVVGYSDYAYNDGNGWQVESLDSIFGTALWSYDTDISIDSQGRTHIALTDENGAGAYYAHQDDNGWNTYQLSAGSWRVGMVLDENDVAHFLTNNNLTYKTFDGVNWTSDDIGVSGYWVDIALDSQNNPHIAYSDNYPGGVNYGSYDGSSWTTERVDDGWGKQAIVIDSNDTVHLGYQGKIASMSIAVAPEPVSTTLFLLGGTLLGLRQYRKRK